MVHWIADRLGHLVVDLPLLLATSLRLEPVGGMTVPKSGPGVPGLDPQEQR